MSEPKETKQPWYKFPKLRSSSKGRPVKNESRRNSTESDLPSINGSAPGALVESVLKISGVHHLIGSESAQSVPQKENHESTVSPNVDSITDPWISTPDQEQADLAPVTKILLESQIGKVERGSDIIAAQLDHEMMETSTVTKTTLSSQIDNGEKVINDQDIIIAVMGPTGVGKSSFIQSLVASYETDRAHHDLNSGTKEVELHFISLPNVGRIVLVDTPGFDDSNRSDSEVLTEIATWLAQTYRRGRLLNGLVYLHRVTDIRFDSGASTTLNIFRKIYGGSGYEKLALVTTMWNNVQDKDKKVYEEKEDELKNTVWGTFLQRQNRALVSRYNSATVELGQDTAQQVVASLLNQTMAQDEIKTQMEQELKYLRRDTITLQLQKEMVDDNTALPRTTAGRAAFTLTETAKYYLRQISQ